jgi:Ran GTPase-activating protein (RanGAP) involved in mRNA processing and transport
MYEFIPINLLIHFYHFTAVDETQDLMQIQNNGDDVGMQNLGSRSLEDLCEVIIEVAGEGEDGENENGEDGEDEDEDEDDDEEVESDNRKNSMIMDVTI